MTTLVIKEMFHPMSLYLSLAQIRRESAFCFIRVWDRKEIVAAVTPGESTVSDSLSSTSEFRHCLAAGTLGAAVDKERGMLSLIQPVFLK